MKSIIYALMVFICFGLSACKTTIQDGGRRVSVEDGDRYDGHGKFCPPGQAKKDNC